MAFRGRGTAIVTTGAPTASIEIGDPFLTGGAGLAADAQHQHAFPAPSAGYVSDVGSVLSDGALTAAARADHAHRIQSLLLAPGGGADLSAIYARRAAALDGIQYVAVGGSDSQDGLSLGNAKATIAAAIAALPASGGTVLLGKGSFATTGETSIDRPVHLRGQGMGLTVLFGGVGSGYTLKRFGTGATIGDIEISDLTIDLNNVASASAIGVEYVARFTLARVRIANIASGWGARIGVNLGTDATLRNSNVLVEDCVFDTNASTTEMLLVFNTAGATVRRCQFLNVGVSAYGIGLYQNLDRVLIDDCEFTGAGAGGYYSLSCNNVLVRACRFLGRIGLAGANQSDNGAFAATVVRNIAFLANLFNTTGAGSSLQLGAVAGATVAFNTFHRCQEIALGINSGNTPVNTPPRRIEIIGNIFRENNQSAASAAIHPALFIATGFSSGLDLHLTGNQFVDDQVTPTQLYAVTFSGAFAYDRLTIVHNNLAAFGTGTSIHLDTGASLGPNTLIYANGVDYSPDAGIVGNVLRLPGGVSTFNKSGAVTDADFPSTPPDGTIAADSNFDRIYMRVNGVWKSAALT